LRVPYFAPQERRNVLHNDYSWSQPPSNFSNGDDEQVAVIGRARVCIFYISSLPFGTGHTLAGRTCCQKSRPFIARQSLILCDYLGPSLPEVAQDTLRLWMVPERDSEPFVLLLSHHTEAESRFTVPYITCPTIRKKADCSQLIHSPPLLFPR
jgi:hypothetical protein